MDNVEWHPFFYNGLETNVEVTKCGRVRRVPKDWIRNQSPYKEVDFSKFIKSIYLTVDVYYKNGERKISKSVRIHSIIACVFLNHTLEKYRTGVDTIVVDHIDSNPRNNHVDNLRLITHRENCSREKTLKSGLPTGVWLNSNRKLPKKKYRASIVVRRKALCLGSYQTIDEASKAYQDALNSLNQFLKDTDDKGDTDQWIGLYYENIKNKPRNNKFPKGVAYQKRDELYIASIRINGIRTHLGSYKKVEDASRAYQEARKSLDDCISENKDPNDWVIEYKNKVKDEAEYRRKLNQSVEVTERIPSNIGEQLPIQFN
jgi:tetratricopeptide (TPR) repeat protein